MVKEVKQTQVDEALWSDFAKRATMAGAEVMRFATEAEAIEYLGRIAVENGWKKSVVSLAGCWKDMTAALLNKQIEVVEGAAAVRKEAPTADVGISAAEFAVAESGSICVRADSMDARLVSMLPPVHVALVPSAKVLPGITEAMSGLRKTLSQGYASFITGPSRTADIERVLTIGVHGPSRLLLLAIDQWPKEVA